MTSFARRIVLGYAVPLIEIADASSILADKIVRDVDAQPQGIGEAHSSTLQLEHSGHDLSTNEVMTNNIRWYQ